MVWIVAVVLLLQALGTWLFQPLVHAGTAVMSLKGLPWLIALVGLWILSNERE